MKQRIVTLLVGMVLGMALLSSGSALSTILTAVPSNHVIHVDGRQVSLAAYEIGGNNYLKLRDIGQAVGFNVYWDGSAVQIESGQPYTGVGPEVPASSTVTEESVQTALAELKTIYPDGTVYPTPYRTTSGGPYTKGVHCAGWAALCSDAAFGDLPWRRVSRPSWDQIRPGDLLEYKNPESYHVVVVLEKTDSYVFVTESGNHNMALWSGQYFKWWLEEQPQYVLYTRYPS